MTWNIEINFLALASFSGVAMKAFKKDQVNSIRYTLGMQKRQDGNEIAHFGFQFLQMRWWIC